MNFNSIDKKEEKSAKKKMVKLERKLDTEQSKLSELETKMK